MPFLILAAAVAFTASPVLGQFRQELPQWAEQGNASDQTRLGLMYDLDWVVPQDDAERVRWKPILIGAGTGFALGFAYGWWIDETRTGDDLVCITHTSDPTGPCLPTKDRSPYAVRIAFGLSGLAVGGIIGGVWALIEAAPRLASSRMRFSPLSISQVMGVTCDN